MEYPTPKLAGSFLMRAVFISLLGHVTLFGMFSLSFGPKVSQASFAPVYFRGSFLQNYDLINNRNAQKADKTPALSRRSEILPLDKINRQGLFALKDYLKPPILFAFNQDKAVFMDRTAQAPPLSQQKESAVMFYPKLPYHFALYFKDRQTVHIELSFEVVSGDKRNSILIKRRISSGNLEVDLLSMRYISRYLFIEQRQFAPDKWQTVKIDLSTVND